MHHFARIDPIRPIRAIRPILSLLLLILLAAGMRWISTEAHSAQIQTYAITVVSAATYEPGTVAPDSIGVVFGEGLTPNTEAASTTPLPITLGGVAVRLKDSLGVEHQAGLFFISPQQINFLVPAAIAPGDAVVTVVSRGTETTPTGAARIAPTAPGLFSANASGSGAAQGFLLRAPATGQSVLEPLAQFDQAKQRWVPRPLQLVRPTVQGERLFFVLFGTGIRGRGALGDVTANVAGRQVPAQFAGAQGDLAGLDQINIPVSELAAQLAGLGRISLSVTVAGAGRGGGTTNPVEVEIEDLPGGPQATITGFEPARALAGEMLTIRGNGFTQSTGGFGGAGPRIRIGGVEAALLDVQDTQIKARIPYGAESGPIVFSSGLGSPATSSQSLTIRTSISGIVEDTRRRPIPGITVRLYPSPLGTGPEIKATTNSDGVFTLPDVGAGNQAVQVDGASITTSPLFPQIILGIQAVAGRDTVFSRPIALQQSTGARIPVPAATPSVAIPVQSLSYDEDWVRSANEPPNAEAAPFLAQQQSCAVESEIRFDLPANGQVFFPCTNPLFCAFPTDAIYLTQVENSRTPVKLPLGHYAGTMAQLSPISAYFSQGGMLTMPNSDCLPANAPVAIFALTQGVSFGIGGGLSDLPQFTEFGQGRVSADGRRIAFAGISQASLYFFSARRPLATILGRVTEPGSGGTQPVRNAIVTARGQEAMTDGNGAFTLRNLPVLGANDKTAVEITFLRPTGRVERSLLTSLPIVANQATAAGEILLSAATANRPPVLILAPALTAEENKRTDFGFLASEADAGQQLQVSLAGPKFAGLINRGGGVFTLRVEPTLEDAGSYPLTVTATDSAGAATSQAVTLVITNANQAPAALSQSVTTTEDTAKEITLAGSDPDRDALQFAIVTQPAHGKLTGSAPDVRYTPDANYFGPDSFTFKVSDGVLASPAGTVSVTISPVNDAPALSVPEDRKVTAGQTLNFAVSATDVDPADQLSLSAEGLPQGATLTPVTTGGGFAAQFAWTPAAAQIGTYVVAIKVADNGAPALTTTRTVAITVTQANAAPNVGMWAPAGELRGGTFISIFAGNSAVFAGTSGHGIFRSLNGGENWTRVNEGLPAGAFVFNAFAELGNTVFVGTNDGIYRSTDNGASWTEANRGIDPDNLLSRNISALAVRGNTIIAGANTGIYTSTNGGQDWGRAGISLLNLSQITDFAVTGTSMLAGSFNGIYRSTDNGGTWTRLPNSPSLSLALAVAGTRIFATSGVAIYLSNDDGANWTELPLSTDPGPINSLLAVGEALFVGGVDSLHRVTARAGSSWLVTPVLRGQEIRHLAASAGRLYAATLTGGVFRSTDGGQNWSAINQGLSSMAIYDFIAAGTTIIAGTSVGFYVSPDDGKTWQQSNAGLTEPGGYATSLVSAGAEVLAAVSYNKLYRTSDAGRTWVDVSGGIPGLSTLTALASDGTTLWAGVTRRTLPSPNPLTVYRSTDQGKSWTPASTGLNDAIPIAFGFSGTRIFASTLSDNSGNSDLFVSANEGQTWSRAANAPPSTITAFASNGPRLFAGTSRNGVYVSSDGGQSWTPASDNLPANAYISELVLAGATLLALTPSDLNLPCLPGSILVEGKCYGTL